MSDGMTAAEMGEFTIGGFGEPGITGRSKVSFCHIRCNQSTDIPGCPTLHELIDRILEHRCP